ncbi:beta-CASP ribonuclease aCPSF1 [Candidatus Woesearchaeota archaeon]|nr:beta-CASP ribonuclease aCPSF1 [Candidatus Woesearchaeota archaeon]
MTDIIKEVINFIPKKTDISDAVFEGANIVLYTKNREFFLDNNGLIREIVNSIKKRVELRADPSITMDVEKAEDEIKKLLPKDAGFSQILFDPQRSLVIIEVEKPGVAIGKNGEVLKKIKERTLWIPQVKRTPSIRSKLIENIRAVLYENNDYRKKFLHKIGKRIYDGWTKERRSEWIRVTFLGAARHVGRSCILLQTPESKVLLDCGIDISSQEDQFPILDVPEFNLNELDAVVLSHAHLDHSGLLPYLFKMGYRGPVYCTLPTRDIAALLGLDFISIAQKDARDAIFSSSDIKEMVKHSIVLDYEEVTDITPDIRITLYDAGHVLGSAMVHIHIGNGLHNLLYTGDINYEDSNLLHKAITKFPRLESVIMEATYGGKDDNPPTRKESEEELVKIIKETIARRGKVLVPVLGVGRAQEIMLIVEKCMRNKLIPEVPVYVQGMVWDVTAIHTAYPDFFNVNVKKAIFHKDQNPFLSKIFKHVGSQKEMQEVIEGGPCIILATSGMMTGGASVEYFKTLADSDRNTIILVSYQGPGSLGRRLENGDREIRMSENESVSVKLNVYALKGFSGHSSRDQLMDFVKMLDPKPKKIILIHGESSKCLDLASSIHKQFRVETMAPRNLDTIRIR